MYQPASRKRNNKEEEEGNDNGEKVDASKLSSPLTLNAWNNPFATKDVEVVAEEQEEPSLSPLESQLQTPNYVASTNSSNTNNELQQRRWLRRFRRGDQEPTNDGSTSGGVNANTANVSTTNAILALLAAATTTMTIYKNYKHWSKHLH